MLFYHPDLSQSNFELSTEESQHLVRVLRKKAGDQVDVTDGKGNIATVKITNADTKKCGVEILQLKKHEEDAFYLHIAIAPTKNIDRITWFVEKAIEIGIHEISFPICKNNERKVIKNDKILAKAVSAMKQSLSPHLPKINEAVKIDRFISSLESYDQKFIAHLANEDTPELFQKANAAGKCCILIGPEGDFEPEEINMAVKAGFEIVKMGNKRLRTETAALYACSTINIKNLG